MTGTTSLHRPVSLLRQMILLLAVAPMAILPPQAMALPAGSTVVAGTVDVTSPGAGQVTLTQTGNAAIVNWSDFSIGAGETVTINQSANAALLNRVTGANPSDLLGQLNADGRVFLINPNGVVVGSGASINAQEFIASTQDVGDAEFLDFINGDSDSLIFQGTSTASVTNAGAIVAADGDVILVGYKVDNSGTITAVNGVAGLAAGKKVWFKPQSAQHIVIESSVSDPGADAADGTGVDNSGHISAIQAELKAAAANVYALAINQTGVIQATGVANRNGRILLTSNAGTISHTAGSLTARNADGSGGEVLVGGDYHGLSTSNSDNGVPLAASTTIGAGATIDVSASAADANGGRAVVWSAGRLNGTDATAFAGTINAQGGASGGDGGLVVVAGHDGLDYTGTVDVSAAAGADGTLVLGLPHVTIAATASNDTANGVLSNAALATQLGSANVVIDAFGSWTNDDVGSIQVTGGVDWTATNGLTLKSGDNIRLLADLNAPNAPIDFQVMGVDTASNSTSVYLDYGSSITADRLTVGQNADSEFIGFNPPPEASRYTGFLNFQGAVKVGTLDLKLENGGINVPSRADGEIDDAISLINDANTIGTLTSSVTGAWVNGNILITDSAGDLTVSGDFSNVRAGANTSITTVGSLTLADVSKFGATEGGEVVLAAKGGTFTNNSSAGADTALLDANSRFLIYSDNVTDTTLGGLTGNRYYGASYANYRPRDVTDWAGNYIFYSFTPTLTFSSTVSRAYGDANPTLAYTVTGLLDGDVLANAFTGGPDLSTAATSSDNVGDYTISVDQGTVDYGSYGYGFAFVPGTLTINPAVLTLTGDAASRLYGAADPTFTGSITGFKLGQDASVLTATPTFTTTATIASGVGEYDINGSGAAATNYTFTYLPGTLTINPAPLTVAANAANREYGEVNPTFDASYTGFVNSDTATVVSGLTLTTAATQASDVGNYTITAAGASAANYTISFTPGSLTVDPAPLSITADAATRLYGATNPTFSSSVTGLKLGQTASVLTNLGYTTNATTTSDVGNYAVTPGGATNPNYSYTYNPGTFTVTPAPLTITANDAGAPFDAPLPSFSASYSGLVAGDTAADISGLQFATNAVQGSAVGTYDITPSGATQANYNITFQPGTLTISNRILNITADDFVRLYGQSNPDFTATVTGFEGPDDLSIFTSPIAFTTTAVASSGVGTYAITPSGAAAPYYDIVFVPGTLTVNPALLTIAANSLNRTYGDANPTFTATFTGLVADDVSNDITGLTLTSSATTSSGVGDYAITATGASNANYTISYEPGTLTVDPAALTVTLDNQTRNYGDANPALTASFNGFKLTDTATVLTGLDPSTAATESSGVGDYAITTGAVSAANYSVTVNSGTLTVGAAPLTLTADDQTRSYGAANPTFTTTASGFKLGQDASVLTGLTVATTATAASDAGTYAITPAGATSANYAITFVPGTLTVDPAALNITADSFIRTYGAPNPTLTAQVDGLVTGDTLTGLGVITFDLNAGIDAAVGTYAITPSGAASANYAITFTPGTLTVNPAPLTIGVDDFTKVYADLNPTFTATVTGLVPDDTLESLGGLTLTTTATQLSGIGDYAITGSVTGGTAWANYDVTFDPGTLTIVARPVTAYANDVTRVYGDANPTVTWGLLGDAPSGMNLYNLIDLGAITSTTAATASSDVGVYAYTIGGINNPNLAVTYQPGSITVTPAPLAVGVANRTRTYGSENPTFTSTTSGLKLTDTLADVVSGLGYATSATVASNVGSYTVTPGGTVTNGNYNVTFNPGTLNVTQASLFIAPTLSSRLYGDADPTFTITATGLLNGDTTAVVKSLNFSGSAPTAGVGSQPISILSGTAQNYALTFGTGILNILARPLTITANDFAREYGEANPTFTATFDGLASFDSASVISGLTFSTPATAASSVIAGGGYGISVSSNANRNYAITYEQGTLTVTPAPLVFGSGSFYRTYGQASPEIGADLVSGLKLTDTVDLLGASVTGPAATADVGTYAITVALTNPNYTVPNASGEMQILPAPIGVNVGNVARRYGDANPDATDVPLTVSGLAFGQTAFDVLSLDFGVDATANVGNYPISIDLFSPNYQIADLSFGNLAVLTRQIALKPENVVRYYGDENPAYRILVAGDGLASFDTIDDVAFTHLLLVDSILTDALPSSLMDVGLHQIRVQPTGNPNYEVISVPGLFGILPRPITLTTADATATENRTPPTFATTATNLVPGQTLQSAFPDLTYNVYAQNAPAAVGDPLTPTTYPIPAAYTEAVFRTTYPAEPAASRPVGDGQVGAIIPIEIDFPAFAPPVITNVSFGLTPVELFSLSGTVNPATLGEQPTDDPQPVTNYIQPAGYQTNTNYVVTVVHNGTLTIQPDPIIVAEKKAAAEAAAAANELPNAREAFFNPADNHTAFGLSSAALPGFVNAVYNQVATERFDGAGSSELQEKIVEMLGLEPGSSYTEAQLYRLMAQIPNNLEVRALFAPVLDNHIRSLVGRSPDSLSPADVALVVAVNDRLAAQQASLASAARQAAQAEMQAYQAEQARTGADRNMINLFGNDIPYDQIVKDALGSVVEDAVSNRLATLIDGANVSTGANIALTAGVSAVGSTTAFLAVGSSVATLLPFSAGRSIEIATTVAEGLATALGSGAAAGAIVATAVVATAVMSVQRGIAVGDNEGQRLIYESLVNGDMAVPTLSDINLDQTKGNGTKKLGAALNENLLSLAIFDLIAG